MPKQIIGNVCHGRYPKQAKIDEVAMSRMVPKDKAFSAIVGIFHRVLNVDSKFISYDMLY